MTAPLIAALVAAAAGLLRDRSSANRGANLSEPEGQLGDLPPHCGGRRRRLQANGARVQCVPGNHSQPLAAALGVARRPAEAVDAQLERDVPRADEKLGRRMAQDVFQHELREQANGDPIAPLNASREGKYFAMLPCCTSSFTRICVSPLPTSSARAKSNALETPSALKRAKSGHMLRRKPTDFSDAWMLATAVRTTSKQSASCTRHSPKWRCLQERAGTLAPTRFGTPEGSC